MINDPTHYQYERGENLSEEIPVNKPVQTFPHLHHLRITNTVNTDTMGTCVKVGGQRAR